MRSLHPSATEADVADYEERAAIMQHVGGLPRTMAEQAARELVNKKIAAREQATQESTAVS